MVLPLLAGILGVAYGTYVLSGIVSHLIQPFSILAALVIGVGSFIYLEREAIVDVVDGDLRLLTHAGIASVIGLVVYKSIAWLLAGVAVTTAIVIIGVILLFGLPGVVFLFKTGLDVFR